MILTLLIGSSTLFVIAAIGCFAPELFILLPLFFVVGSIARYAFGI